MIQNKKVFAIIMAAGKGTRIGATDKPKVMFEVAGKPIIGWAIEPFVELKEKGLIDRIIVVVGFLGNQVIDYLGEKAEYIWQKEQLGTGHAVRQAESLIGNEEGIALIVNGDHALYSSKTFEKMIKEVVDKGLTLAFASVNSQFRFESYGRIIRNETGKVLGVKEVPEATEEELKIKEKSPSVFAVDNVWLFKTLPKIPLSEVKKEYYVNTIVEIAIKDGKKVDTVEIDDEDEALGINTLEEKEEAEKILKRRGQLR
ncbi:MAG: sugar phosphate nucleotidyltransferase [Candidatus Berkelbacteria bacterium]|nr:sugar phosphate nucleotidyltransferase [Candidatus Berkelbacteria bacterium]